MGIDAGFDMVPRLSKGAVDKQNWQSFLQQVKERYQSDDQVVANEHFLRFQLGEHPKLPYEGHKFLRFGSKISGRNARGVEEYINTVTRIARLYFGPRIHYWNEICDQRGYYDWDEVYDSWKSYVQDDEPVIPTTIAQSVLKNEPNISELNLALFKIQSIPGKGKGIVACCNIAKGSRILCEKPIFTTPNLSSPSVMEESTAKKLRSLSKTEQRQFLSLHNNFPGKYPFSGIFKTNGLPCGSGSTVGGVYPTICLINHNCLPNAHNNWNDETRCETIHAIRDIKSGEEISISYDRGGTAASRRAYLKDAFGFDCNCGLCSLPSVDLQLSDARRVRIQNLDSAIGDSERVINRPNDSLADCYLLLRLLNEEYDGNAGALLAKLYYDAFQVSIIHGDQARASAFAEKGYQARVLCEGEESPATQKMKHLMEKPSTHGSYGYSKRWKTAKTMVPKGLEPGEFENWLWKRAS